MKRYGLVIILVFGLILLSACTRDSVEDPDMNGPSGFRLQVSGTANPSTLYVPESMPSVSSQISARVLMNDGTPAVNYTVIFQTDSLGYFDNYMISDTRTTDGSGIARITYYIPPGTYAVGDTRVELKATVVDDGRNDIPFLSEVYDNIPVRIIPYDVKEMVLVSGNIWACSGTVGLPGVAITLSNGGGLAVSRSSGSYDILVPWGWTGELLAERDGFGFIPDSIVVSTPLYTDLDGQDFFATAEGSGLVASPATFAVGTAGASNLAVWVGSVDNVCAIDFRVTSGADWITIVAGDETGTTPGTFRFNVLANGTGDNRTADISIISTTPGVIAEITITVDQE